LFTLEIRMEKATLESFNEKSVSSKRLIGERICVKSGNLEKAI